MGDKLREFIENQAKGIEYLRKLKKGRTPQIERMEESNATFLKAGNRVMGRSRSLELLEKWLSGQSQAREAERRRSGAEGPWG